MATVALMSVAFVSGAAGHTFRADTTVSAKFNKPKANDPTGKATFDGTVGSTVPRCVSMRTVTLYQRAANGSSAPVGEAVTGSSGAWATMPSTVTPGTYYAQVAKKVLRKSSKHRHICKMAVSSDVTVK